MKKEGVNDKCRTPSKFILGKGLHHNIDNLTLNHDNLLRLLALKQEYALDMTDQDIVAHIVTTDGAQKWLEGKQPKKIIVVKGKIINIVM